MLNNTGLRFTAALVLLLGLWTGSSVAAEPAWEQAAEKLRAAALPAKQAEALLAQAQARQIPAAQFAAWADSMVRLHQAGVPATLMAERIQQGLVKAMPAARLDRAVAVLQDHLVWARQVVDRHVPKADIRGNPAQLEEACRSIEASLRAGIERAQLEQIFGSRPLALDQLAALARAAADLLSWGVEAGLAVPVLSRASAAGMSAKDLTALEDRFSAGVAKGRPTQALIAELEQSVKDFQPPGAGARERQILQQEIRQEMRQEHLRDFRQETRPELPGGGMGGGYSR